MNNNTTLSLHPVIQTAYSKVHQFIENNIDEADGYKKLPYNNLKEKILGTNWKNVAFQYYAFFPTHYFKAAYALNYLIEEAQLIAWLKHKQRICLLDIGCGAGAASSAFIDKVLLLKETGKLTNDINILCIGVDPNYRAIGLYQKLMENIKLQILDSINFDFKVVNKGFPDATSEILKFLKEQLKSSQLPRLSNLLVMQLNVISPFSEHYRNSQENYEELRKFGIAIEESFIDNHSELGLAEAQAYKQLLEEIPIDIMHILTIGTKNMEKQVQHGTNSQVTLEERIKEMANTLNKSMSYRHKVNQICANNYTVNYQNPLNSFWRETRNILEYHTEFYLDFQTIINADIQEDKDWNEVIDLDNLQSAWSKARNNLLRETLCDETEIRLFELNLQERLLYLQEQLNAYYNDVALIDDRIDYKVPKNINNTRPRGLSRLEEEILSVAIIQKLGDKSSKLRGSSYAYRIIGKSKNKDTEYLYEYWFKGYQDYIKEARKNAEDNPDCVILRVDIESFYERIIQDQLFSNLTKELTESDRIRWLIRLLLTKNIDEHEMEKGIIQGNLSSGFYANIYLTEIDAIFGKGNEWGVIFHRYVDDMIFIIPHQEDLNEVENQLKEELEKLGLRLNENKTEKIYDISIFLEETKENEILNELQDKFESIVNPLYILNQKYRAFFISCFNNDDRWWHYIDCYQKYLQAINVYIDKTKLSRDITKYLFNEKTRKRDLNKQKEILGLEGELTFTKLFDHDSIESMNQSANDFIKSNNQWYDNKNNLRLALIELFNNSWEKLKELNYNSSNTPNQIKQLEKNIRFVLYRLSILGINEIIPLLITILQNDFWIIRDHVSILEDLAYQEYSEEIFLLFDYYVNKSIESQLSESLKQSFLYLKAIILRTIRYLSNLDSDKWELIVNYSTLSDGSVSIAERLMATETWLYLIHQYYDFKKKKHIDSIKNALKFDIPSRLKKNYLLLLGELDLTAIEDIAINPNDLMFIEAKEITVEGRVSEIFDYPEPKMLREKYYSGHNPIDQKEDS